MGILKNAKYQKLGNKYPFSKYLLLKFNLCFLLILVFVLVICVFKFSFVHIHGLKNSDKLIAIESPIIINSNPITELDALKLAEKNSNIVGLYWLHWNNLAKNDSLLKSNVSYCDDGWIKLTSPYDIKYNNRHWQVFDSYADADDKEDENIRMFLFSTYYDNRVGQNEVVRIISVNSRPILAAKRKWSCLLWFENVRNPALVDVTDFYNIMPDYINYELENIGIYNTQIISCPIPEAYSGVAPVAVSLQSQGYCDDMQPVPSNVLRVQHSNASFQNAKHNTSIGVCVNALRFGRRDISNRLVEWLELIKIFGADKVYIYVLDATDNMLKVLQHYHKQGFVQWRHITQPDTEPNVDLLYENTSKNAKHLNLVELNDCLYRNLVTHDYLALLDINEMIVPQMVDNWKDLLNNFEINHKNFEELGYYAIRKVNIFSNLEESFKSKNSKIIPKYLYKMRHTFRSGIQKYGVRCFHRTSMVSALHSQLPMGCLLGLVNKPNTTHYTCKGGLIPPKESLVFNYQKNRQQWMQIRANDSIHDRSLWRFLDQMKAHVQKELSKIFK